MLFSKLRTAVSLAAALFLGFNPAHAQTSHSFLQSGSGAPTPQTAAVEQDPPGLTYYFLSFSMPTHLLVDTLKSLGKNEVAVFRGPVRGESMRDLTGRMHGLIGPLSKNDKQVTVAVQIDPTRFKKCGIRVVPATCVTTASAPLVAHGILSGDYLLRRGHSTSASLGQTWEIAEFDLSEELKRRIAGITKEDFLKGTIKSVFIERKYVDLPAAKRNAAFEFDPSVIRTAPMVAAGRVIAAAGERFNPISSRGLAKSYVVFDARDVKQIDVALKLVATLREQKKIVRVIVSNFPAHDKGFTVMGQINQKFGGQVTILDDAVARLFRLRAVPAVVESNEDNSKIIVNEVAVSTTPP